MCKHGDVVILRVPISDLMSHTGSHRWAYKDVDRCIAPIVQALNDAGIYTSGACCGHGENLGSILLRDGREVIVKAEANCPHPASPPKEERRELDEGESVQNGDVCDSRGAEMPVPALWIGQIYHREKSVTPVYHLTRRATDRPAPIQDGKPK